MQHRDFWTTYADAMELSVEGNRQIARELGHLFRNVWQRYVGLIDGTLRSAGQHRHLPRV